jgi:ABC-type uncharacterized transport system involved in gliding motility auxiliary subunit
MTKDDAREELRNAIESHADAVASTHNQNMEEQDTEVTAEECDKAIDAFERAAVAEALLNLRTRRKARAAFLNKKARG